MLYIFHVVSKIPAHSSLPQRAVSSPPFHSFSTYPSCSLTRRTVSASPVFFPMLSLCQRLAPYPASRPMTASVSLGDKGGSAYLILTAGCPAAELTLMTMLRGTDFFPVER